MNEQIVALSIDKIQTFLTEVIHSHVQEKQTEDATLRGIINSSDQISNGFFNTVQEEFNTSIQKMLLECSGVYIFRCTLSESEIEERLNNLFVKYYKESQGQKLIRWVYFLASNDLDELSAITEAKKRLKQTDDWNKIIEKNQALLFSFCPVQTIDDQKNNIDISDCSAFVKDINALYKKTNEEQEDKNRFRIAVLKADLDGMGAMFKGIKNYETYKNISQILNKEISLSGLNEAVAQCTPENKESWLFPLYIAGDDIFFAVAIEDLICGVNVCKFIMQSIKKNSGAYSLKLSIGIEITYNRQPIRYYMEMVEAQLKNAKAMKVPDALNDFLVMKLSLGNLTFLDIDYANMKKKKNIMEERSPERLALNQQLQNVPIWSYFLSDVKILNYIRNSKKEGSELLGKSNFFYTLLEDITSEEIQSDTRKYMNHILYRLLPNYFESISSKDEIKEQTITLKEMELLLNSNIIKQLYTKNTTIRKGKPVYSTSIDLSKETKQRFKTYLRLMILFNDDRFRITTKEELRNLHKQYEANEKDIQRYLYVKPREYLYKQSLIKESKQLTNIFVDVVKSKEKDNHKAGYQRLSLESNSFFRLREIDSANIQKAESIIELHNPLSEDEITELNDNRERAGKLPNRLYFDKEKFRDAVSTSNAWNPDFVDSLMLFYQYNELVMKSKKTKDNGGHK